MGERTGPRFAGRDFDFNWISLSATMLLQELLADAPVVTDGAWGTELQAGGLPAGECPDAWNLSHPERVEEVARAYVEAGSRVILTNTFGASPIALARYGLEDRAAAINRAGVAISRRAARDRAYVFASMGPTCKMLITGEVSPDEVHASFAAQARALAEGGADALVIETMTDLTEAEIAVGAAREAGLPVVACMSFGSGKAGDRTIMGVTPEQAAAGLAAAGAAAIGANCALGPAGMLLICARLRAATALPLWIKPNAGLPKWVEGGAAPIYTTTPDQFAAEAVALVNAGAAFIGGCCGTGPTFIRALMQALGR
ncbi:MAG: homocysteine S-methyltransferase family protein [Armatimonadetes bacterium]|nr:homocysteine S-methyltransferase family protein [Armatimonadota bacterium]